MALDRLSEDQLRSDERERASDPQSALARAHMLFLLIALYFLFANRQLDEINNSRNEFKEGGNGTIMICVIHLERKVAFKIDFAIRKLPPVPFRTPR